MQPANTQQWVWQNIQTVESRCQCTPMLQDKGSTRDTCNWHGGQHTNPNTVSTKLIHIHGTFLSKLAFLKSAVAYKQFLKEKVKLDCLYQVMLQSLENMLCIVYYHMMTISGHPASVMRTNATKTCHCHQHMRPTIRLTSANYVQLTTYNLFLHKTHNVNSNLAIIEQSVLVN